MIKEGMIVRYAPDWCSEGERRYLHVVMENRLNPVTGEMTRWLIKTINMKNMVFMPTETVDECMIEPTSFTADEALAFTQLVEDYRSFEDFYDPFGYSDAFSDDEEATAALTDALLNEEGRQDIIDRLQSIADEDDEWTAPAMKLIERIRMAS